MNSAQRRKDKREFPYIIQLIAKPGHSYYDHDDKISQASKWCKRNSKGGFKLSVYWDQAEFKFSTDRDAVYFSLKWL